MLLLAQVTLYTIGAAEMRAVRIKAAKFTFEQQKKSGALDKDAVFNTSSVNLTNIIDNERYYSGFTFVSSVAQRYAESGLKTAYADASHMLRKENSFGTFFDIGTYDGNRSLCSVVCGHGIGTECKDEWGPRFAAAAEISGFDVPGRVTIFDQEKSIGAAYAEHMHFSRKFCDESHVLKNMAPHLGPEEKRTGPAAYKKALHAPSKFEVDFIKSTYGQRTREYLSKYPDEELYQAYSSGLQDNILTSQGAESSMNAALSNKIRCVEPMAMLKIIVEKQCSKFNKAKVCSNKSQVGATIPF
jgi:hypothetical protein